MPTVAASHFVIDLPTLFAITVFISLIGGALLVFAWLQNRNTPALLLWGIGYLTGASAAALLAAPAFLHTAASPIPNALLCIAYGLMWGGARSFEGRRVHFAAVIAGAVICIVSFQFAAFAQSARATISLISAISATYALFAAYELWRARDLDLLSRWPTMAVVLGHASFLIARIPFAPLLAASTAGGHAQGAVVTVMAFEALFVAFALPFLRVAMSKERAELEQRRAAMTDPLTGIANRRAFFEKGPLLLESTAAERRPAALLLFDLDRFKDVNDTAGHQAGDRVLQAFCDLVGAAMQRGDLFGRLGGEEFACLVTRTSHAQALQTAERLRREFAALRLPDLAINPTVSVGVAMASEATCTLPALLALADRALYRAKADGRNRVAPAPLALVNSGDAFWRDYVAPVLAPIAG
jgi:diguanylate cyclase (GGDEF)-like protein